MTEADLASRSVLLKETRDRKISKTYLPLDGSDDRLPAIASLTRRDHCPEPTRTTFRSFDRQWCIADTRVGDFIRPTLWRTWSDKQVYLTSLLSGVLGAGPGATAAAFVPDCHHFRGSYGGKDVIPLWRDPECQVANVASAFIAALTAAFGEQPSQEDIFCYCYAALASPGYFKRFEDELQVPGPRLPVTRDKDLFDRGAQLGRELVRWHTYGERLVGKGHDFELNGTAKVRRPIPGTPDGYPERHQYDEQLCVLLIGDGEIGPVAREVWTFSVSGLQVVKSWLDYRMKKGAGKKSSPLDDIRPERWTKEMTRELLELLWVLEWTLGQYPVLDAWLDEVLAGELFLASEIPAPTEAERTEPKVPRGGQGSLIEEVDA